MPLSAVPQFCFESGPVFHAGSAERLRDRRPSSPPFASSPYAGDMRAERRRSSCGRMRRGGRGSGRLSVSGHFGGHRGSRGHRGGGRGRGGRGGPHRGQGGPFRGRSGPGGPHRGSALAVGPRLEEADVGITEFISQHEGFSAVMKHRFSDFQVNEIDIDGNVVKLTTLAQPLEESENAASNFTRPEIIPEEIWEKISDMVKKYKARDGREFKKRDLSASDTASKTTSNLDEKQIDSAVHENTVHPPENVPDVQAPEPVPNIQIPVKEPDCPSVEKTELSPEIKSEPPLDKPCSATVQPASGVSSSRPIKEPRPCVEFDVTTLDKDSRRIIHKCVKGAFKEVNSNTKEVDGKKFVVFNVGKGDKNQNRGKWPASRNGEYLHFVVHKRNMDTTEIVNVMSQNLWMKPSAITFAGTKDRRGITSQLMSIRRGEPHRLFKISKGMHNAYLGNYCFKEKPLHLGELKGNQFRIALRHVEGSEEQINAGLESLKKNGFINYYGLQRFGTNKAVPTHSVGKALLLGDWQKAIDLILIPREGNLSSNAALEEWKSSKNAAAALEKLDGQTSCLEVLLLRGLMKYGPKDFVNALAMIPLNTRLMYLHSYQSLVWNKGASFRLREFGLKPAVGDLVIVKSEKETNEDSSANAEDATLIDSEEAVSECYTRQEVKCLTEEDVNNHKIEDIVLPLPGYDIVYPNNSVGIFMKDLLKDDGLTSESMRSQVRQYSVRGAYRPLIGKVEKLSWEIVHYNDDATDFIASDFDEMMKGREVAKDIPGGQYKALIITMCLESSTYATMAIREITKKDTSAEIQASISAAATANSSKDGSVIDVKEESVIEEKEECVSEVEEHISNVAETSMKSENGHEDSMEASSEKNSCLKRKGDELLDEVVPEKKSKEI